MLKLTQKPRFKGVCFGCNKAHRTAFFLLFLLIRLYFRVLEHFWTVLRENRIFGLSMLIISIIDRYRPDGIFQVLFQGGQFLSPAFGLSALMPP